MGDETEATGAPAASPDEPRVALVTGASQGIGRAIALAFATAGYQVAVADFAAGGAEATAAAIEAQGADAMALSFDIRVADEVDAAIDSVVGRFGRLDAAVNNAGGGQGVGKPTVVELNEKEWDAVVDSNLKGTWLAMRAQIPAMEAGGGGTIVNIASMYGLVGFDGTSPAYVAAKHGVVGLTKSAALQYATKGIRVNAICPGVIDTPGVRELLTDEGETRRAMEAWHPMNRLGLSEEIAAAALWLCSPASTFMTGTAIPVDGGYTAR